MIYPDDPFGHFGPEYPKGFGYWYTAVILALVLIGWAYFGAS